MIIGITGSTSVLGSALKETFKNFKVVNFAGDICKKKDINSWLSNNNLNAIIHLAAIVPIEKVNSNKNRAKKVNFNGTKNLVDCVKKTFRNNNIWFFYASTSHIYKFSKKKINEKFKPNPISFYGKTKLMGENYIKKNGNNLNYCIGRIFSFTSFRQQKSFLLPNLVKKLNGRKKKLVFNNLNHYRDFLSIKDIGNAIKKLLNNKATGTYNICSGKKLSLIKIVKSLNYKKKELIINKNQKQTMLVGDNKKLKKLKWKPSNTDFINYLKKEF